MQGYPAFVQTDCQDIIFEGEPGGGYNCLSEEDKRQYCDRLVEKVLQEYPHLSADEIMVRLGYVCEEVPARCSENPAGERSQMIGRNPQESIGSDSDRRKIMYADTLCRQVLQENPHFLPSKVKAAVRNLLNLVPEVDDAIEEEEEEEEFNTCINSSSPPSLAVELSQPDCKAHNTAFDLIMEDVLGTRDVCGDIKTSQYRCKKKQKDPCDDPQYKTTLYTALEKSRQQKCAEKKAQTDAELAYKMNCYLTDICQNLETGGAKMRKGVSKSSKKTFADRNPCKVGCDNWVGGDSGFSSSLPTSRTYHNPCKVGCDNWVGGDSGFSSSLPTSRTYWGQNYGLTNFCKDYMSTAFDKANSKKKAERPGDDKGNTQSAFWESNPCNIACDNWESKGGISAGDFKFSVPPRLHDMPSTRQYDPMYMTPGIKTPNVASYGKWEDPLASCCANGNKRQSNFRTPATRSPFQYKNGTDRAKYTFAELNPCKIWDPFCTGRNVPRYGPPTPNYQPRKRYTMSPCYLYPNQRPYASTHVKFSDGINRYCY